MSNFSKNREQISKKWKQCDVFQKILSSLENICDVLRQNKFDKEKNKKTNKKNIAR